MLRLFCLFFSIFGASFLCLAQDGNAGSQAWDVDVGIRLGLQSGDGRTRLFRPSFQTRSDPRIFIQGKTQGIGFGFSYSPNSLDLGQTIGGTLSYKISSNGFVYGEVTRYKGEGLQSIYHQEISNRLNYYFKWEIVHLEFGLGVEQLLSVSNDFGIRLTFGYGQREQEKLTEVIAKREFDESNLDAKKKQICPKCGYSTASLSFFYRM